MAASNSHLSLKRPNPSGRLTPWLGAAWSRGATVAVTAVLQLWLAATMGADEYGRYLFLMAVVLTCTTVALRGYDTLLLRWTARSLKEEDHPLGYAAQTHCRHQALLACVVCGAFLLIVSTGITFTSQPAAADAYAIAAVVSALGCMVRVTEAQFCGRGMPLRGSLSTWVVPLGCLVLLPAWLAMTGQPLSATLALSAHAALQLGLLAGFRLFGSHGFQHTTRPGRARYTAQQWRAESRQLSLLNLAAMAQSHGIVLLLGTLLSTEAVGQLGVAVKLAALMMLGVEAVNLVSSPRFAAAHASQDQRLLQRHATQAAVLSFGAAVAALAALVTLFPFLLQWIGSSYAAATIPTALLATASLINAGCGSVAELLKMSGHASLCVRAVIVSACVGVMVSVIAIPVWGTLGAAVGQAAAIICWNLLMVRDVYRVLHVHSHVGWPLYRLLTSRPRKNLPGAIPYRDAA